MNKSTKRFRLLTALIAVVMFVALSITAYAASSNAVTKDGLTAQLFTDKNSYTAGEKVSASVSVQNNTGREVFIFTAISVPESVTLANESAAYDAYLLAGESFSTTSGAAAFSSASAMAGLTATGDDMQAGFWVFLTALMVLGFMAMFVYGKNKNSWLSMLLCLVMLGSLSAGMISLQAADMNGDIQLSCTIQVDGKAAEVSAIVSYVIYDEAADAENTADTVTPSEPEDSEDVTDNNDDDNSDEFIFQGYQIVAVEAIGDDGNKPENTYDGDWDTRWSYEGIGAWITWDLGEVKNVDYMGIAYWQSDARTSTFDILVSEDGTSFTLVAEKAKTELTNEMTAVDLGGVNARYIKLIGYGNDSSSSSKWNSILEVGFYPASPDGEMILPKAPVEEEVVLPADIQAALNNFFAIYDDDVIEYMANLYDPITGGFYYAVSARDNAGFLPDLESTRCVFSVLDSWVAKGKTVQDDYWPEDMADTLVDWVYNLQAEDGYFYHPQWGSTINANFTTAKRGRDLSWGLSLLKRFDVTPKYPSPLDTAASVSTASVSTLALTSSSTPYLDGEEELKAWLAALPWDDNPYWSGNQVNAVYKEIKAAGLLDVAIEWLDAHQNPDTGLWGSMEPNYRSVSGAMKLGDVYGSVGANFNYKDKIVDCAIQVCLNSETPENVCFVYNPWDLLRNIREMLDREEGSIPDWFTEKLEENTAKMIEKTTEKMKIFKKPDGGFSYFPEKSASTIQGSPASKELYEGDMNATAIAISGTPKKLHDALGLDYESIYDHEDLEKFISLIKQVQPVIKESELKAEYDFEDDEIPSAVASSLDAGGTVELTEDPKDSNNQVLKFTSAAGVGESIHIGLQASTAGKKATVEYKLMLSEFNAGYQHVYTRLYNNSIKVYQMVGQNQSTNKKVWFYDNGKSYPNQNWFTVDGEKAAYMVDTWYQFKLVYTPSVEGSTENVKVYAGPADGTLTLWQTYEGGTTENIINKLQFSSDKKAAFTLYIDDIKISEGEIGSDDDTGECTHSSMAAVPAAGDCENGGNIAYWYCASCGKYFSDEAAATEIALADTVFDAGHIYDNLLDIDCNREGCTHTRTIGQTIIDFEEQTMDVLADSGDVDTIEGVSSGEKFTSMVSASNIQENKDSQVELKIIAGKAGVDSTALAFTTVAGSGEQMDISLPLSKDGEDVTIEFDMKLGGTLTAGKILTVTLTDNRNITSMSSIEGSAYLLVVKPSDDLQTFSLGDHYNLSSVPNADSFFKNEAGEVVTYDANAWHTIKLVYSPSNEKVQVYVDGILAASSSKFFDKQGVGNIKYTAIGGIKLGSFNQATGVMYLDNIKISQGVTALCAHEKTKVEATEATCTTAGAMEYYSCATCNKMFKDEAGTTEITDITGQAKLGHEYSDDLDMTCERESCGYTRTAVLDFTGMSAGTALTQGMTLAWTTSDESSINSTVSTVFQTGASASVVEDTDAEGNTTNVLEYIYTGDGSSSQSQLLLTLPTASAAEGKCAVVEFRLKAISYTEKNKNMYVELNNGSNRAYRMVGCYDGSSIYFWDIAWDQSFKNADTTKYKMGLNDWTDVKLVYTSGESAVNVKVYFDDVLMSENTAYTKYSAQTGIDTLRFMGGSKDGYTIHVDDIKISEKDITVD